MRSFAKTLTIAALLTLSAVPCLATQYAIVDLGTLGGPESRALDINANGQAVGYSSDVSGNYHAVVWDGSIRDLGTVFGMNQKLALAINGPGMVTGIGYNYGDLSCQAFGWQGGVTSNLGTFGPRGINDAGSTVGSLSTSSNIYGFVEHACLSQNGALTDLLTLGGSFSYAFDINNVGQIAGSSYLSDDTTVRACLWQNWTAINLGTLGGTNSQAYAVNDMGKVVGWSDTAAGSPHAFLFTTNSAGAVTARTDLGTLGPDWSYAYGINNIGQVVGYSGKAFVWDSTNGIADLTSQLIPGSGWMLASANAINDAGQIVGWGQNPDGQPHGYLAFPAQANPAAVKQQADGSTVGLPAMVVTAAFDGYFYVEDSSRASGIRVTKPGHGLAVGQKAIVSGRIKTNPGGERYLEATVAAPGGTGNIAPLAMTNKLIGGSKLAGTGQKGVAGGFGLNNIGLLVRTTGKVTFVGPDYFYVDDGSRLADNSGHVGLKVSAPGLAPPALGKYVVVTGASSCFSDGVNIYRQVIARNTDGVQVLF